MTEVSFPSKFQCLFQPKRYKVFYGGRGSGKSWAVARALVLIARSKKIRVLCAREFQNSMKDSVHKLLGDQIDAMGLSGEFEVFQTSIRHISTDAEFSFEGIRHNINKIKSYEGVDICWVEEAQSVSKNSWDVLIPTIRKEESEIWITFNPEFSTDETYVRFVVSPPKNCFSVKVNWQDNPWFPSVLREEKDELRVKNYDQYLHVWEGECKQSLDGAVYAQELREARANGQIMKVPYDQSKAVDTFWDLGWSDSTSIWFGQSVGFEYRIIDYYENSLKPLKHYVDVMQKKSYIYGTDWLPHDAKAKSMGSGKSTEELLRGYQRKVRIVPKLSLSDGINAARTIFSQCYFDEEKCKDGLDALFHYKYTLNAETGLFSKEPLHDWTSHAADAFRYLAIAIRRGKTEDSQQELKRKLASSPGDSWFGNGNPLNWMTR